MESRVIKTWRDPYGEGFNTTRLKEITINKGLTVLVGCNGIGKTTLIDNIISILKSNEEERIPYYNYNNLIDGGSNKYGELLTKSTEHDIATFATMYTSSEGEKILQNVSYNAMYFRDFIKTGKLKNKKLDFSFLSENKKELPMSNERWFLFDATDSGLSIDAVIEIKSFFNFMIEDAEKLGIDLYIIISANEYELAREENCFDVSNGKYLRFKDYDDYRKFILKTREKKDKRYKK